MSDESTTREHREDAEQQTAVQRGQRWVCDESKSDEPLHDYGDNGIGERFVRFWALVDRVDGDYVELTVTRRNPHMKSPEPQSQIVQSVDTMRSDPRWSLDA